MGRGALIVLEGCDRAGKTTQSQMLFNALNALNIPSECRHFPDRTTLIGDVINKYLTCKTTLPPETVHLLFSANRWECSKEITKKLEAGMTIIVDRYAASGAAYGAVNTGRDLDWCKIPDKGLLAPDLVVYLQATQEMQESRSGWAAERFEKKEFQKKVARNFDKLVDDTWEVILSDEINATHSTILQSAMNIVKKVKDSPLKILYDS